MKRSVVMQACPDCGEVLPLSRMLKHLQKEHGGVKRENKYHARRVECDGFVFDSMIERDRYLQLSMLERAGKIKSLELQPAFVCTVNGKKVTTYTADFRYLDCETGRVVIEDVKGKRTEAYVIRRKLTEALFDVKIVEVTKNMVG